MGADAADNVGMLSKLRSRSSSPLTRLLSTLALVGIIAASCSSGGNGDDDDTSSTSSPEATASGGDAPIPGRSLSGPASGPADPPREFPNPPNADAIVCAGASVIDNFTGLPADIDQWLVASQTELSYITDGGGHPGGWQYLSLPEPVQVRAAPASSRRASAQELSKLDVSPLRAQDSLELTFTMREVVEMLNATERATFTSMFIPLDDNTLYGGWSTSVVLYERSDGSIGVIGNCPAELETSLAQVIAAARRADMQGSSTQILTSLSTTEIEQLFLGAYDG
ncbi:MAG: hypothetical protein P8N02_10370 [Actinomycetota bacterium]|nr:hypothetical protein [Actinomycetota bacterium]